MIFLVSQQQQAPKTQKWHPQVSFSGGWKNYVLEKMDTFPTLVKCYGKTVESPVSDHGGLFVKEARTHLFFFSLCGREVTVCVLQFHVVTQISSYALTDEQSEITPCAYGRLKRMENYKTVDHKTLSRSLKRGGRLQQVLITGLWVVLVRTRMFDFLFSSCQSMISVR